MSVSPRFSLRNRLAASVALLALGFQAPAQAASLTLLHNNDGESDLLERMIGGDPYAGAARFVTAVEQTRSAAQAAGRDVITLSSGDNFLAGPAFNASLTSGTFYDALVLNAVNYDAVVIGNHEFDFGPQVLANFISQVDSDTPFLSANLDFSGESSLQALVDAGRIVDSTIVTRDGERYGIIGATTTDLPFISSPGGVEVNPVAAAVQAEVAALQAAGVNKIIFASHLQRLNDDVAAISQLSGIDLVVAGGSGVLLRSDLAFEEADIFGNANVGPYPLVQFDQDAQSGFMGALVTDATGKNIPVVTTTGEYEYLGRIDVQFDDAGELTGIGSETGPILIDGRFAPDQGIVETVINPVREAIAALAANVIGESEVALNGIRNDIRTQETNLGNLIADAFIYQAQQLDEGDDSVLTGDAVIALQNGGGIRNDSVIPAGEISELDTFDILPFSNFLSVFNDVSAQDLKALLEFSVGAIPAASGRFAQIGGFSFVYDPDQPAGERIVQIALSSGELLYSMGQFLFDGTLDLVTNSFTAADGDGYPFSALGLTFENYGVSYQQALFNYIRDGLGGEIDAGQYPLGGEGRITQGVLQVPEPAAFALLGLGFAGLLAARRRRAA